MQPLIKGKSASYQSAVKASNFSLVKTLWYVSKCLQYFLFGLGRPKKDPGPTCSKRRERYPAFEQQGPGP